MAESFYMAAYWGARKESTAEGARRATAFLRDVADDAPTPIRWVRQGLDPGELPERDIVPTRESLEELLMAGRHRREPGGAVVEKLGWHLRLSGRSDAVPSPQAAGDALDRPALRIELVCGAHTAATQNFCRVDLLSGCEEAGWLQSKRLRRLLLAAARAWQPDWATVISHEHRDALPPAHLGRPLVGWMLYLDASRGAIPPLPAPATVEAVGGEGNLIVTTAEVFDSATARHRATALAVWRVLDDARLLAPA